MTLNPPPLKETVDTYPNLAGRLSTSWINFFSNLFNYILGTVVDYSASSIQVPIAGFSITIGDTQKSTILNPAGVLATGTITMPANPADGISVEVATTQTITALTVSPNTGQTIKNAPTTLAGGSGFKYFYV